jgi:hypothetical protein
LFFSEFLDFFCGKNVGRLRESWMSLLPLVTLMPPALREQ